MMEIKLIDKKSKATLTSNNIPYGSILLVEDLSLIHI